MNQPVLVRGTEATWPFVLVTVVAFLLLGLAAWAGFEKLDVLAIILGVVGLVLLLLIPVLRWQHRRLRMWVQDTGDGFKVIDFLGEREFRDDQVLSSALLYKDNFSNGTFKSTTRTFRIWLTSLSTQPELLEMVNSMKEGEADPLRNFLERLNDRLFEQARQDLAAGQSVLGECWLLEGDKLTLRLAKTALDCRLAELAATDVLENHVCLWQKGQDEVFARIPAKTANAHLLRRLVLDHLETQPKQGEEALSEGSLGRILFERRASVATPWLVLILTFICFGIGIGLMVASAGEPGMLIFGAVLLGLGGLMVLLFFYVRKQLFRAHVHGVHQRGLFIGERSLRYAEVASFTYYAKQHYQKGAYTGTQVVITFEPVPEKRGQRIVYSASVQNQDLALEDLRDRVSRMMAVRMAQGLAGGNNVPWLHNLTFQPTGLDYRPTGWFRSKEPVFIPYDAIDRWDKDKSGFSLWQRGQKKPTIKEETNQANFFPGYYLLEKLKNAVQQPAAQEAVKQEDA